MIIQMMEKSGDSEVIVREYYINSETTINIKNVPPKKYLFKSIYDANRNGKWDTGIFMKKIQPEQVRYMRNENSIEEIVVKANWDNELEWNIKLREED
jgi:type II secretory pathway component PulJ